MAAPSSESHWQLLLLHYYWIISRILTLQHIQIKTILVNGIY